MYDTPGVVEDFGGNKFNVAGEKSAASATSGLRCILNVFLKIISSNLFFFPNIMLIKD